jgi:hypothetical protein
VVNRDYRDLFAEFNARQVEFLIVGAFALAVHGHLRATKDLDLWVRPVPDNAGRVFEAVSAFSGSMNGLFADDFSVPGTIVQLGVEPTRIDLLTRVEGLDFETAWTHRIEASYGDQRVFVISRADLIASKRAAARPQDLADLAAIEDDDV